MERRQDGGELKLISRSYKISFKVNQDSQIRISQHSFAIGISPLPAAILLTGESEFPKKIVPIADAMPVSRVSRKGQTKPDQKCCLVDSGIGSLAAAAFKVRDGAMFGSHITIHEAMSVFGGSLDGGGNPKDGYTRRGGRMLTTDNYECTRDLSKSSI